MEEQEGIGTSNQKTFFLWYVYRCKLGKMVLLLFFMSIFVHFVLSVLLKFFQEEGDDTSVKIADFDGRDGILCDMNR